MSSAVDRLLVIGVGNALRGDDAAGLLVARRVRDAGAGAEVVEHEGDPTRLIELLDGASAAVLVDALRPNGAPGTLRRYDVSSVPLPPALRGSTSTHAVGLAEVIELARALGRLPPRVVVLGVEGRAFGAGAPCTPQVDAALDAAVAAVLRELRGLR